MDVFYRNLFIISCVVSGISSAIFVIFLCLKKKTRYTTISVDGSSKQEDACSPTERCRAVVRTCEDTQHKYHDSSGNDVAICYFEADQDLEEVGLIEDLNLEKTTKSDIEDTYAEIDLDDHQCGPYATVRDTKFGGGCKTVEESLAFANELSSFESDGCGYSEVQNHLVGLPNTTVDIEDSLNPYATLECPTDPPASGFFEGEKVSEKNSVLVASPSPRIGASSCAPLNNEPPLYSKVNKMKRNETFGDDRGVSSRSLINVVTMKDEDAGIPPNGKCLNFEDYMITNKKPSRNSVIGILTQSIDPHTDSGIPAEAMYSKVNKGRRTVAVVDGIDLEKELWSDSSKQKMNEGENIYALIDENFVGASESKERRPLRKNNSDDQEVKYAL